VFLDLEHPITTVGLTPGSTYKFYLIVVDEYLRYVRIYGPPNKSTKSVIEALKLCEAEHSRAEEYCFTNVEKILADHGSQFTSGEFQNYCCDARINLVIAPPKKQY
jgi:transposase InsO family protein